MKYVTIKIGRKGIAAEADGYKGEGCLQDIQNILKDIADGGDFKPKEEFYDQEEAVVGLVGGA
jgi:hypothetical protein